MNLATAEKMLALLEQSPLPVPEDDAHFIIYRLLRTEIRKGNDASVLQEARREFHEATREEVLTWLGSRVHALKMYRERTCSGLYEAKMQLEAGASKLNEAAEYKQPSVEVTSCG